MKAVPAQSRFCPVQFGPKVQTRLRDPLLPPQIEFGAMIALWVAARLPGKGEEGWHGGQAQPRAGGQDSAKARPFVWGSQLGWL